MQSTQNSPTLDVAPQIETFEDDFTRRFILTARRMVENQDQHKIDELARLLKIKALRSKK